MPKTILIVVLVAATWLTPPLYAENSSPASLYAAALARERGLRSPGVKSSLNDFRAAIAAYEVILRRFPASSYDDHALWQSTGLAIEAYDRYHQQYDLEQAVRLLRTLQDRNPTSSFTPRVPARLHQLDEMSRLAWLSDVEREVNGEIIRVTMHIDQEVRYRSAELSDPPRLFFDFPGTEAPPQLRNATMMFEGDGDHAAVRAIRLGRHPQRTTRVVLDVINSARCDVSTLHAPFRLVVACTSADGDGLTSGLAAAALPSASFLTLSTVPPLSTVPRSTPQTELDGFRFRAIAHELQPPLSGPEGFPLPRLLPPRALNIASVELVEEPLRLPTPEPFLFPSTTNPTGDYSIARQLGLNVSRIVIDPGHGGHDPGARARGLAEADLVLDVAHRLAARLSAQPGLEVVMTRRGDHYLPLEARTTLANRVQADLFLSIHANASRNAQARGVETYFLNLASDPEAERLAARENVAGIKTMHELEGLLQSIATNSKVDESRDFATTVQRALLHKLRTADSEMPDLGVKQAPFVVLIGARMPSVLAEISFVTNSQDATMLSTDAYRDLIADALFDGIVRYRQSLGAAPLLALQAAREDF